MERARGDEENVAGVHVPVRRSDGAALDQRQQIPLHALRARGVPLVLCRAADLVDLIKKNDTVLLRSKPGKRQTARYREGEWRRERGGRGGGGGEGLDPPRHF